MKLQIIKSDYAVYGFLTGLILLSFLATFFFDLAYAETIRYSNSYPRWVNYPCDTTIPTTGTIPYIGPTDRNANHWKYFFYYDSATESCYATIHGYDFTDILNLSNATDLTYHIDTKSTIVNDLAIRETTQVSCVLMVLEVHPSDPAHVPSFTGMTSDPFVCADSTGDVLSSSLALSPDQIAFFESKITPEGANKMAFIIFPLIDSNFLDRITPLKYNYALANHENSFQITGDGFSCITIEASNWCNFFHDPWGGIRKALGEDYIGDWFYVLVFFPIPMMVFLTSRNGTYAGFVSLPIILFINTIDQVVFEISLSMLALAGSFGFYELLRKRLVD